MSVNTFWIWKNLQSQRSLYGEFILRVGNFWTCVLVASRDCSVLLPILEVETLRMYQIRRDNTPPSPCTIRRVYTSRAIGSFEQSLECTKAHFSKFSTVKMNSPYQIAIAHSKSIGYTDDFSFQYNLVELELQFEWYFSLTSINFISNFQCIYNCVSILCFPLIVSIQHKYDLFDGKYCFLECPVLRGLHFGEKVVFAI